MSKLVQDILNTDYGDWNLDGLVDLANFNKSLRGDGSGSWASGDGNKDGGGDEDTGGPDGGDSGQE